MGRTARLTGLALALAGLAAALPARATEPADFARFLASLGLHRAAVEELHKAELQGAPQWQAPGLGVPYAVTLLAAQEPVAAGDVLDGVLDQMEPGAAFELAEVEALVREANGQHATAVALLGRAEAFASDPVARLRAARLRCALHLRAVDVEAGAACAQRWLPRAAWQRARSSLLRSPRAGWWRGALLSAVVPGLGQAVGGAPLDAAAALAVNGGLWTLTVDLYSQGLVLDGTLLLVGMTSRYYAGNIQHGARAVQAAVEREQAEASQQLLRVLVALPEPVTATE